MTVEGAPIACPECDLLGTLPELIPGQRVRCARCGYLLVTCSRDPFARALAFAVAGLIMIGIALTFPFLSINASGVTNSMTLIQTVSYLAEYGAVGISVVVFVFVILVPVLMLVLIAILSGCLDRDFFHPLLVAPARWLFHLNAWAMVEVFAIGVIVSLVKLAHMADVGFGHSFWAYLAFTVLFLLSFSSMDRLTIWSKIEDLNSRRGATI